MDLSVDIEGRDVVVVEDILDSGVTLSYLKGYLGNRKPASLRIVSTPTDIESIKPLEVSVQKELRDGQIIINRNGEQYSITGQKL